MSNAPAIRLAARLLPNDMTVHLVNPSHLSFGVGVILARTQAVWDRFYSLGRIWARSRCELSGAARVRVDLEVIQADVREHWDRYRQRACEPREPVGTSDCQAMSASVYGASPR